MIKYLGEVNSTSQILSNIEGNQITIYENNNTFLVFLHHELNKWITNNLDGTLFDYIPVDSLKEDHLSPRDSHKNFILDRNINKIFTLDNNPDRNKLIDTWCLIKEVKYNPTTYCAVLIQSVEDNSVVESINRWLIDVNKLFKKQTIIKAYSLKVE